MSTAESPGAAAVYRLFDADRNLLYVGCSGHVDARLRQHEVEKPWWPDVQHRTICWYDSHTDALLAEKQAICDEGPRHNRRDSPHQARRRGDPLVYRTGGIEIKLRLPPDLYEKLRRAAFEQRTSMNALVVEAVRAQQEAT